MTLVQPLVRYADWETRLHEFMLANRDRPFAWGEWDCILFACAAAAAITGEDMAADFRGQYTDQTGAREALRTIGKGTLLRTIDDRYARKPAGRAIRGDMIWRDGCVGVSLGASAAFLADEKMMAAHNPPRLGTMILIPRTLWQKAWDV